MPEPTYPCPPRFWWLKRIALGWLIVIALLLIIRLIWGWEINRRMNNQLAEWRAQGQPTRPEDFAEPDVPEAENAALVLKSIQVQPTPWEWLDLRLPLPPKVVSEIRSRLALDAQVIQAVRKARAMDTVGWVEASFAVADGQYPPSIQADWDLIHLLRGAALYVHHRGDDAEMIECIQDLLFLDRAYAARPALRHGAGYATKHAIDVVLQAACDLNSGPRPAGKEQVQRLIAALMDEELVRRPAVRAALAERLRTLIEQDTLNPRNGIPVADWISPDAVKSAAHWLTRPAVEAVVLADMRTATDAIVQIAQSRAEAIKEHPVIERRRSGQASFMAAESLMMMRPSIWASSSRQYASSAPWERLGGRSNAVAAAICIAIRMYQIDHDGRLPANLNQLAPVYLPAIPADPWAGQGKPFRYEPNADPPFLLSVGSNRVDDLAAGRWSPQNMYEHHHSLDMICPLARRPQPSKPKALNQNDKRADDDVQPGKPGKGQQKP